MSDSNESTEHPVQGLLRSIDETLKSYFDIRRQRAARKLQLEKKQSELTTEFAASDARDAQLEAELAAKLKALIMPNEVVLLTGKLRSFATNFGKVSFKRKPESTRIVDAASFERQARKDRVLTTLGSFTRTWKPLKIQDIQSWLAANPKRAKAYQPFLETTGGFDEVFVKPNEPYLTEFDPNQLTASSVNLGEVPFPRLDEKSPDA